MTTPVSVLHLSYFTLYKNPVSIKIFTSLALPLSTPNYIPMAPEVGSSLCGYCVSLKPTPGPLALLSDVFRYLLILFLPIRAAFMSIPGPSHSMVIAGLYSVFLSLFTHPSPNVHELDGQLPG